MRNELLLLAFGALFMACEGPAPSTATARPEHAGVHEEEEDEGREHVSGKEDPEVAVYMGRVHVYAQKLWASGQAGNLELAKFYQHEIEEVFEDLEAANVVDDGVDISAQMHIYGLPAVEALEEHFEKNGLTGFVEAYDGLLNNCNACHMASGYPIVKVIAPTEVPQGQDFSPQVP